MKIIYFHFFHNYFWLLCGFNDVKLQSQIWKEMFNIISNLMLWTLRHLQRRDATRAKAVPSQKLSPTWPSKFRQSLIAAVASRGAACSRFPLPTAHCLLPAKKPPAKVTGHFPRRPKFLCFYFCFVLQAQLHSTLFWFGFLCVWHWHKERSGNGLRLWHA